MCVDYHSKGSFNMRGMRLQLVITREVDFVMFDVCFLARHLPCWKCVNRYLLLLCKIKRHWDRHGCIDTLHRCSRVKSKHGQVQCRCAYVQQSTWVLMHAQVLHFDLILFVGSKHVNFFCWRFRCSKLEWSGDIYRLVQSILTWFFQDRYVII